MARVVGTIRFDPSGLQPMLDSMQSLGEALTVAHYDGPMPVDARQDGLFYGELLIAAIRVGPVKDWTASVVATPTFRLPLFAAAMCQQVGGLTVEWRGGWPHCRARDEDPETEPVPALPTGVLAR